MFGVLCFNHTYSEGAISHSIGRGMAWQGKASTVFIIIGSLIQGVFHLQSRESWFWVMLYTLLSSLCAPQKRAFVSITSFSVENR